MNAIHGYAPVLQEGVESLVVAAQGCVEGLWEPGHLSQSPVLSPYQHSPIQGPPGAGEGSIYWSSLPGVSELLQCVVSEDAYGQGQLGAVRGVR